MDTETISDCSDAISAIANAVDSDLLEHDRAFELINLLVNKIEEELKKL